MKPFVTSATLLRDIADDALSPRWSEFVSRYRPMMEAYLDSRFPTLSSERDDIVQETFLAVMDALPQYRYVPQENGAFHNYLTGILRNKALMALRRAKSEAARREGFAREAGPEASGANAASGRDLSEWCESVLEIALRQMLADPSVAERTKQAFIRTAVKGEDPESVARALGVERHAVDQMKSRTMARLKKTVHLLEHVLA